MQQKPAASTAALEALITWKQNKTSDWIRNLTDEERSKFHRDASKNVMQIKDKSKDTRVKILQGRRQKMIDKQKRRSKIWKRKYRKSRADLEN